MERNPYTLVFGREPLQVIPRVSIVNEVVETFCEESPSQQILLITGVRGSGKSLAANLSSRHSLAKLFQSARINLSYFGYFAWRYGALSERATSECKQYLDDYAYEKTWSGLSQGDREVARAIAEASSSRVRDVRELAHMSTNQFSPYRNRLVKKGIVDGTTYGHVSFALPLFDRYVMEHY